MYQLVNQPTSLVKSKSHRYCGTRNVRVQQMDLFSKRYIQLLHKISPTLRTNEHNQFHLQKNARKHQVKREQHSLSPWKLLSLFFFFSLLGLATESLTPSIWITNTLSRWREWWHQIMEDQAARTLRFPGRAPHLAVCGPPCGLPPRLKHQNFKFWIRSAKNTRQATCS